MIINMNGAKAPETPSPVLQEKTVTPETLPTVIGADEGYDGLSQVTVNPDAQLKAENIRFGKSIFGVTGTFEGEAVATPVPYGNVLYGKSPRGYEKYLIKSNDNIPLPTPSTYTGPVNYYEDFSGIWDTELRRFVAPNTFTTRNSSFSDYYCMDYDATTLEYSGNLSIYPPITYTTQLASSVTTTAKFVVYAQAGVSVYGAQYRSTLFHPISVLDHEVTLSSNSSKDYIGCNIGTITVDVPAGKVGISRRSIEDIVGGSNGKYTLSITLALVGFDYSALYE